MSDVRSSQPIQSLATSNPVKVSADLNANAVGNPIFITGSDGTNQIDYVVIDSAFGATPVATPIAGKYEATPTTYADGDATPFLTDAQGRLQVNASAAAATEYVDDSAFTVGTDKLGAIGGIYVAAGDTVQDGDIGALRMTDYRAVFTQPYDGTNEMPMMDANTRAGFMQLTDGTDDLGVLTIDSAFGATPTAIPIAAKYEATPTSYADGDAVPLLTDANGRLAIDIATQSLTAVAVSADGNANAETNPLFVQVVDGALSGIEVVDYDTSVDVAVDASDNHDYTVTGSTTLKVLSVSASSAQPLRVEVQSGPVASLVTSEVQFSSAANRNVFFDFSGRLEVPDTSTGTLRIIRKNIGDSASDVYSTLVGSEV